jgi:hypothetical protein
MVLCRSFGGRGGLVDVVELVERDPDLSEKLDQRDPFDAQGTGEIVAIAVTILALEPHEAIGVGSDVSGLGLLALGKAHSAKALHWAPHSRLDDDDGVTVLLQPVPQWGVGELA